MRQLARKILAFVRLIRPLNCLLFAVAIVIGLQLAMALDLPTLLTSTNVWIAVAVGVLIGGASNVINDYYDQAIDAVNRPDRPIPSGLVDEKFALVMYVLMNILALVASMWLGLSPFIMAAACIALLYFYSAGIKGNGWPANLLVAAILSLALIFGGVVAGNVSPVLPAALLAFLANLAREIIKDVEDIDGDRKAGQRSIAITKGANQALRTAIIIIAILIAITPIPYLYLGYDIKFLAVIFAANILLASAAYNAWPPVASGGHVRLSSQLLKASMIAGLLAFMIS